MEKNKEELQLEIEQWTERIEGRYNINLPEGNEKDLYEDLEKLVELLNAVTSN